MLKQGLLEIEGFEDLFVISSTSTLTLLVFIFINANLALLLLVFGPLLFTNIYKIYGSKIDAFYINDWLTSKFANKLAISYLYPQALVIGVVFGWVFGSEYFS